MTYSKEVQPICVGCGKRPNELPEYIEAAREDARCKGDADRYVVLEEGTLNRENGHFLCTPCYIEAGQPSSPGGWHAP